MSKVDLYPHNQTAYLKIKQAIENGDTKMAIAHATGTGKSYISARLFEDYNDDQKLVLVPTNFLYQNHKGLFDEYGIQNTHVMTYQSLIKKDFEEINRMNYKVVVLDEYHHSTAKKWGESVRELIKSHPETIFLGTSATPVRTDGVNTIDEMFDSNCVSELPVSKAIALGILPMPRYVAVDYAYDKRFDELAKKVDKSSCTKEEKEEYHKQIKEMRLHVDQSYGMPIILNKYIENESGKYIVFCRNKKHLEEIKDTVIGWFKQAGFRNVNSYVVHSQNEEKDKEFQEFCNDNSDSLKLLFCINMLSEGLHLKGVSGVILLRTTNSNIVFQQQIGRALAANDNGVPLVIDAVNNYSCVQDGIKMFSDIKDSLEINNDKCESKMIYNNIDSFLIIDFVQNVKKVFEDIENIFGLNRAKWESYEDEILKKFYVSEGVGFCVKQLPNKTKEQCKTRARYLGLKTHVPHKWTQTEIEILIANYEKIGNEELTKLIPNHTKMSIYKKSKELNLYKNNEWDDNDILFLKKNYNSIGCKECANKLNKPYNNVYNMAKELNLQKSVSGWSNEEIILLQKYYPSLGVECVQYIPNKTVNQIRYYAQKNKIRSRRCSIKQGDKISEHVYWDKKSNRWRVTISISGKLKNFGSYITKAEAIKVAIEKEKEYGIYR